MPTFEPVELHSRDLAWCVRRLPAGVKRLLLANPGKIFVAGGFIRSCVTNDAVSDVDVFIGSAADADRHLETIAGNPVPDDSPMVVRTANAVTYKSDPPVQIIHRWTFDQPIAALAAFDFTIACAALWHGADGEGWRAVCHPQYYADLAAKRLVYLAPDNDNAGGSFLRLMKFYRRGYRAPLDDLGALLAQISASVTVAPTATTSERATAYAEVLREVDPAPPHDGTPTAPASCPQPEDEEVDF